MDMVFRNPPMSENKHDLAAIGGNLNENIADQMILKQANYHLEESV